MTLNWTIKWDNNNTQFLQATETELSDYIGRMESKFNKVPREIKYDT